MESNAMVVEVQRRTVGIAVKCEAGIRFFAADPDLVHLEGRAFASLIELERAVREAPVEVDEPV